MRYESLNPRRLLAAGPGLAWERTRAAVPSAVLWSTVLVLLIAYTVAGSTVTADWVPGLERLTLVALGAALLMAALAVLPVPWWGSLGAGVVMGAVVAGLAAGPLLHSAYPSDPPFLTGAGFSLRLVSIWWGRIADGSASSTPAFFLYLITWLMWVTGGWLSWCVLRWRQPMLGLAPAAAAFVTNVLNNPTDQNGYTLVFLILTLALLLWTNYTGSIASATKAQVKLTGDARWDFWESGLVAMAALIVLAIMLPPLSTYDRTTDIESSAFTSWAQLLQALSHPGQPGTAGVGRGTTGFSADVLLNSSLKRTH